MLNGLVAELVDLLRRSFRVKQRVVDVTGEGCWVGAVVVLEELVVHLYGPLGQFLVGFGGSHGLGRV
jgi:hypothetical protein